MAHRIYYPQLMTEWSEQTPTIELSGQEWKHVFQVKRKRLNDQVQLFDGNGYSCLATVEQAERNRGILQIDRSPVLHNESISNVMLVCAFPKGDRCIMTIEKCTELGIECIQPVSTDFSVADPDSKKIQKLNRTVIEACKQCGRNRLMHIAESMDLKNLWEVYPDSKGIFLDSADAEQSRSITTGLSLAIAQMESIDWIAIGPEGGWSELEIKRFEKRKCPAVRIPGHILRIETAAIYVASILNDRSIN